MAPDEILKDIRKRCRLVMNGIASASMRERGLDYKLNFGVSILKIREIASHYTPNSALAEVLWLENTRELKILATLLYPIEAFSKETANRWVVQIPNQEIREQLTMNLLQNLPDAVEIGHDWSNNNNENIRITGYWLITRCIIAKKLIDNIDPYSMTFLWHDIISDTIILRNATLIMLKNIGKISVDSARIILEKLGEFKTSGMAWKREVYESLFFEFDFHHTTE